MKEPATADIDSPRDTSGETQMHLVLIDGSGFIFRAFHALPPMTRPDGTPVNAVFGFTNMLARLLKDHTGTHIAVIFDAGRYTFRNRLYEAYKANRPPAPEELIQSVISALRRLGDVEVSTMDGIVENIEFRLPAELRTPAAATV